jgi:hypothetical protein
LFNVFVLQRLYETTSGSQLINPAAMISRGHGRAGKLKALHDAAHTLSLVQAETMSEVVGRARPVHDLRQACH